MSRRGSFTRMLGSIILLISICAIGVSSIPQQTACESSTVSITASEGDGKFVSGLTAADFRATLAGQSLHISSVTAKPAFRRIIFIIHTSGRMRSTDTIRASLSLTANIVNLLPPGVEFALVTFNDDHYLDQPLTNDKAALVATLHRLDNANNWRGSSAVFDAVNFGIQNLPHPTESDAIVLISNGIDNASKAKLKGTIENIAQSGIRIFTVGVPRSDQVGTEVGMFRQGQQHLDELAAASGGESFNFSSSDSMNYQQSLHMEFVSGMNLKRISEPADAIVHEMASGYSLRIEVLSSTKKPTEWKLESTAGEKLKIRYPKKLSPCSSNAAHK